MVTFRNNNRRSNFRRNDRNHKRNGEVSKFKSHFPSKDGFQRTVPSRNNYNASKLVEKYNRPTALLASNNDGTFRGSVRSVDGFSVINALESCDEFLESYGGHKAAAGFTVLSKNISSLHKKLNFGANNATIFFSIIFKCFINIKAFFS